MGKVYAATPDTSTVLNQPPAPKSSRPTAAAILGLSKQQNAGQPPLPISIEMEIDQYLSDPNQGTGVLEFWQVGPFFITFILNFDFIYITGTSTSIPSHFLPCNGYHPNPSI